MWSALRRAAIRESGHYAATDKLEKYRTALFRRFVTGKLRGPLIPLRRAEILGRRLVERIERRSMSSTEKEQRDAHRQWARQQRNDRKLYREMPDLDHEVLQKGFGFVYAMLRAPKLGEEEVLKRYIQELFDLLMGTLPQPEADDERSEIEGTPYESDIWIMARVAEFVAHANSVETAQIFYRPIFELGPAAKYWVEDFLQSWIDRGLQVTNNLKGFADIWQDMVAYAETLPAWQPGEGHYWCRGEELARNLMGLSEGGIAVLGDAKYKDLVGSMAPTFERWGSRWLKYGSVAGWFAYFLWTESGRVVLSQGVKQLAAVAG